MAETKQKPAEEKAKDTVRKRQRSRKMATQRYVPIGEVRNDTIILKNGGLRAVLEIEPLNFNLKSETEQQGIVSGYQQFLNTITFPLQIVMRSTKVNVDPYIQQLKGQAAKQENDLLRDQTESYADFIEKVVEVADIMQKKFLVIVPLDDAAPKKSPFADFFSWIGVDDSLSRIRARRRTFGDKAAKLKDRVNLVESGLRNVGLMSKRMNTRELIDLFYEVYNPDTSLEQKLPNDLNTDKNVI